MKEIRSSGPSWIAIIIMMIVFWPVGVYLLYKRLKVDRKAVLNTGGVFNAVGIIFLVLGIIGVIACKNGEDGMGLAIFFLIFGVVMKKTAYKNKKHAIRIRQYIALIVNQHITSLDELCRATGNTYTIVCEDLNKMIEKGYLPGAYLNLSIRKIILPGQKPPVYKQSETRRQMRTKVVQCKSCGADVIVVEGTVRKCEYCGTPIQG